MSRADETTVRMVARPPSAATRTTQVMRRQPQCPQPRRSVLSIRNAKAHVREHGETPSQSMVRWWRADHEGWL
jgi:hypothetical protein